MRFSPLLMQFESGISIKRYLPASGTAGFDRYLVKGKSRVPRPPPRTMVRIWRIDMFRCAGVRASSRREPDGGV